MAALGRRFQTVGAYATSVPQTVGAYHRLWQHTLYQDRTGHSARILVGAYLRGTSVVPHTTGERDRVHLVVSCADVCRQLPRYISTGLLGGHADTTTEGSMVADPVLGAIAKLALSNPSGTTAWNQYERRFVGHTHTPEKDQADLVDFAAVTDIQAEHRWSNRRNYDQSTLRSIAETYLRSGIESVGWRNRPGTSILHVSTNRPVAVSYAGTKRLIAEAHRTRAKMVPWLTAASYENRRNGTRIA
eukprot:1477317-Rhodomonas_salina.1